MSEGRHKPRSKKYVGLFNGLVASLCLLLSVSCSSGGSSTDPDDSSTTLEEEIPTGLVSTNDIGEALVPFGADEAQILLIREADQSPIENALVGYASFEDGTLVWAHTSDTFPIIEFVPLSSEGQLQPRIAVTTLVLGGIAVWSVGSAIYEFIADPPKFVEIIESDNAVKRCISGDLNDILAAFGFANGVAGVSTTIKVVGAPAQIRGVTAINLGIRKADVVPGILLNSLSDLVANIVGIFQDDILVGCRPSISGQNLPYIEIDVQRPPDEEPLSDIVLDLRDSVWIVDHNPGRCPTAGSQQTLRFSQSRFFGESTSYDENCAANSSSWDNSFSEAEAGSGFLFLCGGDAQCTYQEINRSVSLTADDPRNGCNDADGEPRPITRRISHELGSNYFEYTHCSNDDGYRGRYVRQ